MEIRRRLREETARGKNHGLLYAHPSGNRVRSSVVALPMVKFLRTLHTKLKHNAVIFLTHYNFFHNCDNFYNSFISDGAKSMAQLLVEHNFLTAQKHSPKPHISGKKKLSIVNKACKFPLL